MVGERHSVEHVRGVRHQLDEQLPAQAFETLQHGLLQGLARVQCPSRNS